MLSSSPPPKPLHLLFTTHLLFHDDPDYISTDLSDSDSDLEMSDFDKLFSTITARSPTPTPAPTVPETPIPADNAEEEAHDLFPGSVPWSQREESDVTHCTFYIPPAGRGGNSRLDKYVELEKLLDMTPTKTNAQNSAKKAQGKDYVQNIRAYLLAHPAPLEVFNDFNLQETYWYHPDITEFPYLTPSNKYCFDIVIDKIPTKTNTSTAYRTTPSIKRARTVDKDSFLDNEQQNAHNETACQLGLLAARIAELELSVKGSVSQLADPNLPSSTATSSNPSLESRVSSVETKPVNLSLLFDLSKEEYTTVITDIATHIRNFPENPYDAILDQLKIETGKIIKTKAEEAITAKPFQQFLLFLLKDQIMTVARTAALNALQNYVDSEPFKATLTPLIEAVARQIPLSILEKDRFQQQLIDYIRPLWSDLERKLLTRDTSQAPPTDDPPHPPSPPRSHSTTVDSYPTTAVDVEALKNSIKEELSQEQRDKFDLRAKRNRSTNLVAAYLTAKEKIQHSPSGGSVVKHLPGGKFASLGPAIVASHLPDAEKWERESAVPPPPPSNPPPTYPPPPPPAPYAQPPYYGQPPPNPYQQPNPSYQQPNPYPYYPPQPPQQPPHPPY
ncbi:hypothetical protein BJ508DRAFT_322139 [Ascobolus immersus RN42]|uniref:Uncharacterized protein n=1 Tax=Ascobolus immersus RN42 TaxID=1160509 RepID=A0A3N4IIN3_ASCIM|nr:hypothetical protein BJ508DRAFT_322139 [Ascobolus immersus RN42]